MRFEWDDANREHIARHNVVADEIEEAFEKDMFELDCYQLRGEDRYESLGATATGRILFIVTTMREDRIRVVTAYDATRSQRLEWHSFHRSRYE